MLALPGTDTDSGSTAAREADSSPGSQGGADSAHAHAHANGATAADSAVADEVSVALMKRLEASQNEAHNAKRTAQALRENMDLMKEDVQQKKDIIRNLVSRIETGALITEEAVKGTEKLAHRFRRASSSMQSKLFSRLEIVFQESILQNNQLRRDINTMGLEMQTLQKSKSEIASRHDSICGEKLNLENEMDELTLKYEEVVDDCNLLRAASDDLSQLLKTCTCRRRGGRTNTNTNANTNTNVCVRADDGTRGSGSSDDSTVSEEQGEVESEMKEGKGTVVGGELP